MAVIDRTRPEMQPLIHNAVINTINRANSIQDLPQGSGFQLMMQGHVLNAPQVGPVAGARDHLRSLVQSAVTDSMNNALRDRRGTDDLKLGLSRFQADIQDLAVSQPLLRGDIQSAVNTTVAGSKSRFNDIAHANDSW